LTHNTTLSLRQPARVREPFAEDGKVRSS
jgi:hypothetical protein